MSLNPRKEDWHLPLLKEALLLKPDDQFGLYDVKFYPFTAADSAPVFAVVSSRHVFVYRVCPRGGGIQLIQKIEDDDKVTCNNSLAWSKDLKTGAPLLCLAGGNAKIKIIDVGTGELQAILIGHGGDINDLTISPLNPQILASGSADNTVRLWSLDPAHSDQPCVVLCAGHGHLDTVLSIAFHATGQYILSGGQDNIINLWILPKVLGEDDANERLKVVHFPHFSTGEVHSNIVDCVKFHGDLILSKAFSEHCIVLWMITGFNSASPLPASTPAPTNPNNEFGTRSAFSQSSGRSGGSSKYMRLLQFDLPGCTEFYMRFGLSSNPDRHPVLAVCNNHGKIFFWDLSRLVEYHRYTTSRDEPGNNDSSSNLPKWLATQLATEMNKEDDLLDITDPAIPDSSTPSLPVLGAKALDADVVASKRKKYSMTCPQAMIGAHSTMSKRELEFDGRQVAWSDCGRWCVVVGTPNVIIVLERGENNDEGKGIEVD